MVPPHGCRFPGVEPPSGGECPPLSTLKSDELTGLLGHRRQPDALQRRCPHRLASKPLGVLGALCLDDEADTDEYTGHDLERNVIHASGCQVILDRGENVSSRKAPARHSANNVVAHYLESFTFQSGGAIVTN